MAKPKIIDRIMSERIEFPGFAGLIVTRGFAYQYFVSKGWDRSEKGFGSIDYLVLAKPAVNDELTEGHLRDHILTTFEKDLMRQREAK